MATGKGHYSVYLYDYNGNVVKKLAGPFYADRTIMERIVEDHSKVRSNKSSYVAYDHDKE